MRADPGPFRLPWAPERARQRCGFCSRAGERDAQAAPNACPFGCRQVYAWWINGTPGGNQCFAVEKMGTKTADPTTHTSTASPLYNTAPTGGSVKTTNPPVSIDRWIYPSCYATCGLVGGQWQTPQEASPANTGRFDATITQTICQ